MGVLLDAADGVTGVAVLGFAKGSEVAGFLLRFFFSLLEEGVVLVLVLALALDGVLAAISPGSAKGSSSIVGDGTWMATEGGVAVCLGVVLFFFCLTAFTGVATGISSSLSELISEDEIELPLLTGATGAGVAEGCSWENLHLSPFLHP